MGNGRVSQVGGDGALSQSLSRRGPLRNLEPRAPARSRSPRLAPPSPQPSPSGRGGGGEGTHKRCPYGRDGFPLSRE